MKPRWKLVLPKHRYGGFPMPGGPDKRSPPGDCRPAFPFTITTGGYRKVVSHGDPHGTAEPYSMKRNYEGN